MEIFTWSNITSEVTKAISNNQFFTGGAVLGILVFLGNYLKEFPGWLWGRVSRLIFYTVNIEELDELFYYFEVWLAKNHKAKYRNVEASLSFRKLTFYQRTYGDSNLELNRVNYKQFNDSFIIRRGIHFIKIVKDRQKFENANSLDGAFYNKFVLTSLLSKSILDKLINEVLEFNLEIKTQEKRKVIDVKSCTEYGHWVKESVMKPKSMDKVFLDCKEEILNDISNFLDSKDWYNKHSLIYKRGYMFYGSPGNGKTTFILSLAKDLERSVNFLNLSNISDAALREAFRDLTPDSILVVEDIDAVFVKRDGKDNIKFSFSTLLNCLDGAFSKENVITIFTTNHPELLDDALIRDGRIDNKFEFKNPSVSIISEYLSYLYDKEIEFLKLDYSDKLPMVALQNICIKNKHLDSDELIKLIRAEEKVFSYPVIQDI